VAKAFTLTLELPQPTVKVAVEFYDDTEKQKLLKYPTGATMDSLVATGLEIPTEEFLGLSFVILVTFCKIRSACSLCSSLPHQCSFQSTIGSSFPIRLRY
jgi:hypothetical protein